MIQRLTAWFPVLLLGAVAATTLWLDRHVQPPEVVSNGRLRHDPDYIAENFTVTRVGPDGVVRYRMKARRMQHYPDDDTTELEAPNVINYRDGGITMTATSRTAKLSSNGDHVYLQDDVKLTRSPYQNHSELVMLTTWLHVVPDDGTAQTDKPVRIQDVTTLITSDGLEFDNKTRILKLLSNVRGRYEKAK